MLIHKKFFCALLTSLLIGACTTSSTKSINAISDTETTYFSDPEERELFKESEKLHAEFVRKGLLYRDSALTRYINKVSSDIQPQAVKDKFELRFFVMRDPSVNAFALPNGNIYLNIGLLNKLNSESQLAFVMAHEAVHVINRHGFKSQISRRNDIVGAHIADFFLAGTGLSYLAAVTSIANYSRELEIEADNNALNFLATTPYSLSAVINTFNQLQEVKHEKNTSSIWASHPDANKRKANATTYIEKNQLALHDDYVDSDNFIKYKSELTESTVKMRLRLRQYQLAQEACETALPTSSDSAVLHAYIGDSYRLRLENTLAAAKEYAWLYDTKEDVANRYISEKEEEFTASAHKHYELSLAQSAENATATRGLGLLYMQQNQTKKALVYLQNYLTHKNIPDRRFIETKIKTLQSTDVKQ